MNFDVVFISYDEPCAETNFFELVKYFPNAKRVHGILGFDEAHQYAAEISESEFTLIVDADAQVLPCIKTLKTPENIQENQVISWPSENSVNKLRYGNGGLKLWKTSTLSNVNSHNDATDWCWQYQYITQPVCMATSIINDSPFTAFRSGYREAVKLLLVNNQLSSVYDFRMKHTDTNKHRLQIWCSVGADAPNGFLAMYGARLSVMNFMFESKYELSNISNYEWFKKQWDTEWKYIQDGFFLDHYCELGDIFQKSLNFNVGDFDSNQSKCVKDLIGFRG